MSRNYVISVGVQKNKESSYIHVLLDFFWQESNYNHSRFKYCDFKWFYVTCIVLDKGVTDDEVKAAVNTNYSNFDPAPYKAMRYDVCPRIFLDKGKVFYQGLDLDRITVGTLAVMKCNEGFKRRSYVMECHFNKNWSAEIPSCGK